MPSMDELKNLPDNIKQVFLNMYNIINEQAKEIEATRAIADRAEAKAEMANNFIASMVESQGFEQTMVQVESMTMQMADCDKASFYRLDETSGKFYNSDGDYREWTAHQDSGELLEAMEQKEVSVEDTKAFIPVMSAQGNAVGVIVAERQTGFDDVDLSQFRQGSQWANNIALAIKKDIHHQISVTDPLTGLKNRAGNDEFVKSTVVKNLNEGKPISIIMSDIDHFKHINDTYGHDAGDAILKKVAEIINSETRNGMDCAFRFGGEEMIVVLSCTGAEAMEVAERIRKNVEETVHEFEKNGEKHTAQCTISMGVSQMSPELPIHKDNAIQLFNQEFKKADNAVYVAKASGRNQIVAAKAMDKIEYLANKGAKIIETAGEKTHAQAKSELINCFVANDMKAISKVLNEAVEINTSEYNNAEAYLGEADSFVNPQPQIVFTLTENDTIKHFHTTDMTVKDVMDNICSGKGIADFMMMNNTVKEITASEADIINKLDNKIMMNINKDENTFKFAAGRKAIDINIREADMSLAEARKISRLSKDSQRMMYDMIRIKMGRNAISDNLVNNVVTTAKEMKKSLAANPLLKKLEAFKNWAKQTTKACDEHKQNREAEKNKQKSTDDIDKIK